MKKGKVFWTPLRTTVVAVLITVLGIVGAVWSLWGTDLPVFYPSGEVAEHERNIIVFTMALSLVVIIPVYTMLIVFSSRFRKNRTHKNNAKYTPDADSNHALEAIWWGIPIALIVVLANVAWFTSHSLDPHRPIDSTSAKPLRVQVITLQWRWLFVYPDLGVASLNQMKIPAHTPINLEITADAPMSSFWVPALGSQVYSMAGMNTKLHLIADKAGMYRGTNTNINGKGYSSMDFDVVALDNRNDFDSWVKTVHESDTTKSLSWNGYKALAKPTEESKVTYYTVDDKNLFNRVLNKFMNHDTGAFDVPSIQAPKGLGQ